MFFLAKIKIQKKRKKKSHFNENIYLKVTFSK